MLVHIVADYGQGDLAFAEVAQRIKRHLPDAEPVFTPVPPFATLAAGFCVAQLALNAAPRGTIVYHNVAPREDDASAREGNAGEKLAYARLGTGVRVIGVNAGHAFSFLRGETEEFRWAAVADKGSQFRSRDLFPAAAAAIALGQPGSLAGNLKDRDVPAAPALRVAYVDGYGNMKTTIPLAPSVRKGSAVHIEINGKVVKGVAGGGSFEVKQGQLALAPGSSGWKKRDGTEVRWMEIFLRGGNAWETFGRPPVGAEICLLTRKTGARG